MTQNPKVLLVFSIGPVQDFIKVARRTQDLWMGSYILAYLASEGMRAVVADETDPVEILFPTLAGQPLIEKLWKKGSPNKRLLALATLPNKFTARVVSLEEGRRLGLKAEAAVRAAWQVLAGEIRRLFPAGLTTSSRAGWHALWDKQVDPQWLEVYWAVHENVAGVDFGAFNSLAEQALGMRKGLRNFGFAEDVGEKCTVCGIRSALAPELRMRRRNLRAEWGKIAKTLHERGQKKRSSLNPYSGLSAALNGDGRERLCAICASKRLVQRLYFDDLLGLRGGYPSTSSLASICFRQAVLESEHEDVKAALADLASALKQADVPQTLAKEAFPGLGDLVNKQFRYDGEMFYPETYTVKRLQEDYHTEVCEKTAQDLQGKVKALRKAAKAAEIAMPPTYYAVMLMDGDNMGKRLAESKSVKEQREISDGLRDFALQSVQKIVEDAGGRGRVVYAGGDDVMAFLPIETVLPTAEKLRRVFQLIMDKLKATYGNREYSPTASAGIVIAHHRAPLDNVLEAVRRVEQVAKNGYGRNAVAVAILKRSGEPIEVGAKWEYGEVKVADLVQKVYDHFRAGTLSSSFAHDAYDEAYSLDLASLPDEAHKKLLGRLWKRRSGEDSDDVIVSELGRLGQGLKGEALPDKVSPAQAVARWLLVARFLVRASSGED